MESTIDQAVALLNERLTVLNGEVEQVQTAIDALVATKASSNGDEPTPKAKAPKVQSKQAKSPAKKGQSKKATTKTGKSRKNGGRTQDILSVLAKGPNNGLTVQQIAERMNVRPTYLYRVVNKAVEAGTLAKDGKNVVPATA